MPARSDAPKKVEVVVLALADAGGRTETVDTEDVAVAAHRLAPDAFSWRKHPEQINLDSVRVTLTDACKEKYGALVRGSVGEGWHLTEAGVTWANSASGRLRDALGFAQPETRGTARAETRHATSEIARLKRSDAYRAWVASRPVSPRMAAAVFRIDAYTSQRDRTIKTNRLKELINSARDDDIRLFVDEMAIEAPRYVAPTREAQGSEQ